MNRRLDLSPWPSSPPLIKSYIDCQPCKYIYRDDRGQKHVCWIHGHYMAPPNGLYKCTEIEDNQVCEAPFIYYKANNGKFPIRHTHNTRKNKCKK